MKEHLRGFSKIFSFTFTQHVRSKGYKNSFIIITLLCLLIPALIMVGLESSALGEEETTPEGAATGEVVEETVDLSPVKNIFAVDLSEKKIVDGSSLTAVAKEGFGADIAVTDYGDDFEKARKAAKATEDTLLLVTEQRGDEYTMNLIVPEKSGLSEDMAQDFGGVISAYADMMNMVYSEDAISTPVDPQEEAEEPVDPAEEMENVTSMVLNYLNTMLLYFFVLAYGQGVANSVVMEKSSKLMENFLVSVKPTAIVLGKLLAITLTGILQLFSWILALIVSFAVGTVAVKSINPETDMMIIQLFQMLGDLTEGMLSPVNCIMAILIVMSGMLLYCALAAIGGAMASKAEDLSSANVIFTMVLVISFLACIYGGGMSGEAEPWLDWVPFTSVMITPAKALLGNLPLWKTAACFGITLVTTLAATFAAGKVYKSLVLYKGDALRPKTLIKILKGQ